MRFGLEAEFLLENIKVDQALELGIPGVTREFFDMMVEVVTGIHQTRGEAVEELRDRTIALQRGGAVLHPFASHAFGDPWDRVGFESVTGVSDYYRWVYYVACQNPLELHHVGIHINASQAGLVGDALIHATNWLRCLNFLFILLGSNSPLQRGLPSGCLSRRSYFYPNRYDVPLWCGEASFRAWVRQEEALGKIYPGKARCWMSVCPRLEGDKIDSELERIELRSLDSGANLSWEVLEGCCQLLERIVVYSGHGSELPVDIDQIQFNDKAVARLGRQATLLFEGRSRQAEELARYWCQGIESLEQVLDYGSQAEKILNQIQDSGVQTQRR